MKSWIKDRKSKVIHEYDEDANEPDSRPNEGDSYNDLHYGGWWIVNGFGGQGMVMNT
jgi:hypothetical protein